MSTPPSSTETQSSKRVLVVTPYWPPVNRVGVWRPLRICRYLNEWGWTPIVCSPDPQDVFQYMPTLDQSFSVPDLEVIRPRQSILSMTLSRSLGELSQGLDQWIETSPVSHLKVAQLWTKYQGGQVLEKILNRLIRDTLLPDQMAEWGLKMARLFKEQKTDVDIVWATGGPFGMLVAGALIARSLKVPYVLDYRDGWTGFLPKRSSPLAAPPFVLQHIERLLVKHAHGIGFINQACMDTYRAFFGQPQGRNWKVIPNGFDPIDLGNLPASQFECPTLVYAGNCYDSRSFNPVLEALSLIEKEDQDQHHTPQKNEETNVLNFRIRYYGQLDPLAQKTLAARSTPLPRFTHYNRIPSDEVGAHLKGASGLILIIGRTHQEALSAKVFDYLAAGRPILGIGPPRSAAQRLIEDHQVGLWVDHDDIQGIKEALYSFAQEEIAAPAFENTQKFHARSLSRSVAELLNSCIKEDSELR